MYQKTVIVGRLGADPTLKYSDNGEPVTSFSVATSTRKDETAWFGVTVWGASADACNQYLKKGSKVLVEGRLSFDKETGAPRVWKDKDGVWRSSFELMASQVVFLSGKDGASND